jgi:hypothetical protein
MVHTVTKRRGFISLYGAMILALPMFRVSESVCQQSASTASIHWDSPLFAGFVA